MNKTSAETNVDSDHISADTVTMQRPARTSAAANWAQAAANWAQAAVVRL